MALPYNHWHELVDGPGVWKLAKVFFCDLEEEQAGLNTCTLSVLSFRDTDPNHALKVTVEQVKRSGSLDGSGYFFYDIVGTILGIDGKEWPDRSANQFQAYWDPTRRCGSFKVIYYVGVGPKA